MGNFTPPFAVFLPVLEFRSGISVAGRAQAGVFLSSSVSLKVAIAFERFKLALGQKLTIESVLFENKSVHCLHMAAV